VVCVALRALMAAPDARAANPAPIFLVATQSLSDPLFRESVILMLPPEVDPIVAGVIINKPTTIAVRKLFPRSNPLKRPAAIAYFGGPVDLDAPSVLMRAAEPSAKASRLFDDIYMGTDPDSIAALLRDPARPADLRVFLGRAQWSREQLHGEMLQRSWYIVPAKAEMVFSADPDSVWRALVQRAELQEVEATELGRPGVLFPVANDPEAQLRLSLPGWP
jgi:putative transcriptional regulator